MYARLSLSHPPPGGWMAVRIGIGSKTDKSVLRRGSIYYVHVGDDGTTLGQRLGRVFSMVGDGDMALATDDRLSHTEENSRVTEPPRCCQVARRLHIDAGKLPNLRCTSHFPADQLGNGLGM